MPICDKSKCRTPNSVGIPNPRCERSSVDVTDSREMEGEQTLPINSSNYSQCISTLGWVGSPVLIQDYTILRAHEVVPSTCKISGWLLNSSRDRDHLGKNVIDIMEFKGFRKYVLRFIICINIVQKILC